jgi:hypothetical protein
MGANARTNKIMFYARICANARTNIIVLVRAFAPINTNKNGVTETNRQTLTADVVYLRICVHHVVCGRKCANKLHEETAQFTMFICAFAPTNNVMRANAQINN